MRLKTDQRPDRRSNTIIDKAAVLALAGGCCLAVWVFGKGNQEILALPLAFWLGAFFWPDSHVSTVGQDRPVPSPKSWKPKILWIGVAISWTVTFVGMRFNVTSSSKDLRESRTAIENALAGAEARYHDGEFARALAVLDAISIPDHLPLLEARRSHDRGIALLRLSRTPEATENLLRSLQNDPRNVEAACLLSEIAITDGDLRTARLYVYRALAVDGSYASARQLLARLDRMSVDRRVGSKP